MKIIETDRLILRQYTSEDIKDLYKILSDPITMSFWPTPFTLSQVEGWVNRNIESYRNNGFGRLALILKETMELVGDCGIMITETDGKETIDLGYIISHKYWNKGYGTEAARACAKYGLEDLKLKKIYANMAHDNIASKIVAENIGMKREKEFYNKRNREILTYLYTLEK